jgi:hypothetical protein
MHVIPSLGKIPRAELKCWCCSLVQGHKRQLLSCRRSLLLLYPQLIEMFHDCKPNPLDDGLCIVVLRFESSKTHFVILMMGW